MFGSEEQQGSEGFRELRALAGKEGWKKYSGNPVLTVGTEGEWDSGTLATMSVLKVGDTLHMYYEAGVKGVEDYQMGHAVSTDGIHWEKDKANPVMPFGRKGEWDDAETWDPFVLYEDGVFKMWYGGTGLRNGKRDFQVGYATSHNGTDFTGREQISNFANGSADAGVGDMHVVHDSRTGKYYMYYRDGNYAAPRLFRVESANETDFDFDNAVRITVLNEDEEYRCPHVFINNGMWYMYYGFKYKARAGYATSDDGLHWTPQNTAVIKGDDPEILKIAKDLYLLFYCPTEYDMGHKLGCDIRVAVFEGHLDKLASTEQSAG